MQRTDATASASADRVRGRLMAGSLGALLDRVRGSREVLRHLAALERALAEVGVAAVHKASEQGLAKICAQLGSLPLPADDPPLHDLLDRVEATLEARRVARTGHAFDSERTVVIQEISHSDFMAVAGADAMALRDSRP